MIGIVGRCAREKCGHANVKPPPSAMSSLRRLIPYPTHVRWTVNHATLAVDEAMGTIPATCAQQPAPGWTTVLDNAKSPGAKVRYRR